MELKTFRKKINKSQADIAQAIGISERTYGNYETCKTDPDIPTLIKLADYFHTTIDSIVGHDVPFLLDRGLLTEQQNYIIDKIKTLSPQECERVEAFIAGLEEGKRQQEYIKWKFNQGDKR